MNARTLQDAHFGLRAPVVLFVYRRCDYLLEILKRVADARPPRVYVFADAPGEEPEDRAAADEVLAMITRWSPPFPVDVSVAPQHLGNKARFESGIASVFETEDRAIFVEDDVDLAPSFFVFCDRLLTFYSEVPEVMMISGFNPLDTWPTQPVGADHLFSTLGNAQASATWRRAWHRTEGALDRYRQPGSKERIAAFVNDEEVAQSRTTLYDALDQGRVTSWDYPWALARQLDHGLTAVPARNLARHLGRDAKAVNLKQRALLYDLARLHDMEPSKGLDPPLVANHDFDRLIFEISHDKLSPASAKQIAERLIEGGRRLLAIAILRHVGEFNRSDLQSEPLVREALKDVTVNRK